MWRGYFALGGLEIANSARAIGYARTAGCPLHWFTAKPCPGFLDAMGVGAYDYAAIEQAPWYDPDNADVTSRFYGVFVLAADNISDSTATASVTEKVTKGGRIGRERETSRAIRFRALLSAEGTDALEVGQLWLASQLKPGACGQHGEECGVSDLEFFLTCPPVREPGEADETYEDRVNEVRLFQHETARTSGPFKIESLRSSNGRHYGRIVEFTITAEDPSIYGITREIGVPPILPSVIQDIAYNLIPVPGAELSSGTIVVATNFSTNPSVETNLTGWSSAASPGTPTAPRNFRYTRVGNDISLFWDAPADLGAGPIIRWWINRGRGMAGVTEDIPVGVPPYTDFYTETTAGWINQPDYSVLVRGENALGEGDWSGELNPYPALAGSVTDRPARSPIAEGASNISPFLTFIRNNDLSAPDAGLWSARARVLGNGAAAASGVGQKVLIKAPAVALAALPATSRPSASIWGAAAKFDAAPGSRIVSLAAYASWTGSTAEPILMEPGVVTTAEGLAGTTFWLEAVARAAAATHMQITLVATVDWVSSATPATNSDIRIYADAHAVTVP